MNDSYVIRKEQCPECAKLGKDNSHDNLAVYNDGHTFCYSCGISTSSNKINSFKNEISDDWKPNKQLFLPLDCDIVYPQRAIDWIEKYDLTKVDLYNNNVLWSDSLQRLIFPVYGNNGMLIAWQGRSFHLQNQAIAKIPKWFGKGNLKDTFNILGKGDKLILTEDIISAIKVSKCGVQAMPLYGCVVGRERFKRLYSLYKDSIEVDVWLDPDKRVESVIEAKLGRITGLNCTSIFSEVDPKELSYDEIKNILV